MALLSGALSSLGVRLDPVLGHNFVVGLLSSSSSMAASIAMAAILDVALGGFSECSGLEMQMQPEEYKEGGNNGATLKFASRVTWSNIVLKHGVGFDTTLWDWHYGYVTGTGSRKDGFIVLLNDLHVPNNIWYFQRGLPVKYTGPSMAASQSNVAIESVEIAHEGIWQMPGVGIAAAALNAGIGIAKKFG